MIRLIIIVWAVSLCIDGFISGTISSEYNFDRIWKCDEETFNWNWCTKVYYLHVDDTLVFIKKDEIQHDLNIFNFFAKNLPLNIDAFDNANILFVDIKIPNNGETDTYII